MEKEEERGERLIQRELERGGGGGDRGPMGEREEKFNNYGRYFLLSPHHIIG